MKIWLSLVFLMAQMAVFSQSGINRVYGDGTGNTGYSVIVEDDGYFVAGGGFSPLFSNRYGIKLFRLDSYGDTLWTKIYGEGNKTYQAIDAIKLSGNGYVICGWIRDVSQNYLAMLYRINNLGDTLWTARFAGADIEEFRGCVETPDKGIAAFGQTNNMGDINGDFLLVKYDSSGHQIWNKNYGGSGRDAGNHIALLSDGGFLLSGISKSFGNGLNKNYLIRTNSEGDTLWTRTYGSNGDNGSCGADVMQDGNYLMSGLWDTIVHNGFGGVSYVTKLDTLGNIIWVKFFDESGNIGINYARELPDSDIAVVGQRDKPINYFYGGYLCCLDPNGHKKWDRTLIYNGNAMDTSHSELSLGSFFNLKTSDTCIVMVGTTNFPTSDTTQIQEVWLVKTDSTGCINTDCGFVGVDEIPTESATSLDIHPNPTTSKITIEYPTANSQQALWAIYDLMGKQIASGTHQGTEQLPLDVVSYPKGIYIARAVAGSRVYVGKFVVEKGRLT